MSEDRDDFSENGENPDKNMKQEFFDHLQKTIKTIRDKLDGETIEEITLEDVAQYVRVINYNFAALSGTLFKLSADQETSIETLGTILTRLDSLETRFNEFFEMNSCINTALDNNDESDN